MTADTIGFIGAGNMGSAMIGGILKSGFLTPTQIFASAHTPATLEKLETAYGIKTTLHNYNSSKFINLYETIVHYNKD